MSTRTGQEKCFWTVESEAILINFYTQIPALMWQSKNINNLKETHGALLEVLRVQSLTILAVIFCC